jgi:hypothetical protein
MVFLILIEPGENDRPRLPGRSCLRSLLFSSKYRTANDLIAKIKVPYDTVKLNAMGVQEANTYVATLVAHKTSPNVHRAENFTRIKYQDDLA